MTEFEQEPGQEPEVVEGQEPEGQTPPAPEAGVISPEWMGRLQGAQSELAATKAFLQASGYDVVKGPDGQPQIIQTAPTYAQPGYQQPQPPAAPPPTPEGDPYDRLVDDPNAYIDARARQLVEQQVQPMQQIADFLLTDRYADKYNDWAEIGPEVTATIKGMGFNGFAHVVSANRPDLIELAVNAARGRRLQAQPGSQATESEAQRQARLAAAAPSGGPAGRVATGADGYDFTAEERAEIRERGLTPQQAVELMDAPARPVKAAPPKK